jgi:hypothetical protein
MISAAIATWTIAWSQIRDEFRARLHGLKIEPWWEHARLLRVMGCSHAYAWNIQQTYNQRRGTNLLLSPLDWLQLEMWADAGIPQCAIERAIHEMFDRRDHCMEPRQINSLAYCEQVTLKHAELIREASVGSHEYFGDYDDRRAPHTLLLAVPPAGRMTFAAMQSQRQVDRVAEMFQVGIVFTVYPDAWHKSEASSRYGVELEFLDQDVVDPVHLSSGSRRTGSAPRSGGARSRQPFLNQEANG